MPQKRTAHTTNSNRDGRKGAAPQRRTPSAGRGNAAPQRRASSAGRGGTAARSNSAVRGVAAGRSSASNGRDAGNRAERNPVAGRGNNAGRRNTARQARPSAARTGTHATAPHAKAAKHSEEVYVASPVYDVSRPSVKDTHAYRASRSRGGTYTPTYRADGKKGTAPSERDITLPGGREVQITRRHFLYGAIGVVALAAIGGGTVYASSSSNDEGDVETLTVPESNVFSSNDLTEIEGDTLPIHAAHELKLPLGSLTWCCDDSLAACLLPGETGKPLVQIGLIDLEKGDYAVVVEHAVGEDDGFEIYDVRANGNGVIWTEANILDGIWRVYAASVKGADAIGEAQQLDEGHSDNWEMPTLACSSAYGFWQCLPQLDGDACTENSLLKRAKFGSAQAEVVYESQGRMACPPTSCGDAVIATPRARTSGTYYQLTRIDGATGTVTDACVLPSSMKPIECGWGKTGFAFLFDSIYNYGEGIANLGTYMPLHELEAPRLQNVGEPATNGGASAQDGDGNAVTTTAEETSHSISAAKANISTELYSGDEWFHYARTPNTAPAWCDNWLMLKGQSRIVGIDLDGKRYFSIPSEEGADSFGDYLASTNIGSRVLTYSSIDYTPVNGDAQQYCLVRIWETGEESGEDDSDEGANVADDEDSEGSEG